MDKFNQFDVNEQYDKEAALKYGYRLLSVI